MNVLSKEQVDTLRKNPLFAMSLSNKELFHSNFLAWILLDVDLTKICIKFREKLGINSKSKINDVDREKSNFDLLIHCEKNENEFVLIENKFKSVPSIEQLEKYTEKLKGKIDVITSGTGDERKVGINLENTNRILLAPNLMLKTFNKRLGLEETNTFHKGWSFVSFEAVIEALENDIKEERNSFKIELLENYISFCNTILLQINFDLDSRALPDEKIDKKSDLKTDVEIMKSIRLNDYYQKIWFQLLHQELVAKKTGLINKAIFEVGFTRAQGLITYRFYTKKKDLNKPEGSEYNPNNGWDDWVGVQIQGNQFRVMAIQAAYENNGKDLREKFDCILKKCFGDSVECRGKGTGINKGNLTASYSGKNASNDSVKAAYRYVKLNENISVDDLRDAINCALDAWK